MSRFEDPEKFGPLKETLAKWEVMCTAANGKYLFGTDEPTLLDSHAGAIMDYVYTFLTSDGSAFKAFVEAVNAKDYPNFLAYCEKLRAHPLIAPYRIRKNAMDKYMARAQNWEKGVKCQLNLEDVSEDLFVAEP